jgi:putative aldouronate transport system substrate-binding protein
VVSTVTTPEFKKTIQLLKKMCGEGLISKDFPITKTTEIVSNFVDKEKTGLWLSMGVPGPKDTIYLAKKKTNSNLKLADLFGFTYLKDSSGNPRIPAESGFNGGIAFPKSSVKDESRFKQILKVFSYISTKDGQRLVNSGIEGIQYTKVDDTHIKAIPEDKQSGKSIWDAINQMSTCGNYCYSTIGESLTEQLGQARKTFKESDLVGDITVALNSNEYAKSGAKLSKLIDTAMFKYILGLTGDSDFQSSIEEWKTSGGDKMTEEYMADYKKSQTK